MKKTKREKPGNDRSIFRSCVQCRYSDLPENWHTVFQASTPVGFLVVCPQCGTRVIFHWFSGFTHVLTVGTQEQCYQVLEKVTVELPKTKEIFG